MNIICGLAAADDGGFSASALKRLSIEELMDVEVTSVSRTAESLGGAAAAVTVVTNEDIRRSGATSVPEALRLVPGIHVARNQSSRWAVSSRGFSSVNSEKLLVLSDTRSIYTPLFSGVFWDVQDYLLEDIDRIEVIRGPGAALWGSNAVNGVINITTKSAQDTQGLYAEAGAGTEERASAAVRYGGKTEGGVYYRVFGKYFDRDATFNPGASSSDDWQLGHFGFRADWDATERDTVTVQGDVYRGDIGQLAPSAAVTGRPGPQGDLEVDVSGGNILGRWRHRIDEDSDLQFRAYYDRTHRDDPSFLDDLDTVDLDFQHRFALALRHEIIWGLNYRYTSNRNESKGIFAVDPSSSQDHLVSAFVQDQISILDTLRLTLGTKFEHNDFSGFEVQPSARVAWDLLSGHTLWGAVSRAVRVPTRLERDIAIDVTDPAGNPVVRLLGNEDFDSEELLAYELGYRWQALETLFIDVAAFHNRYEGLASLELGQPFIDPKDGRTVIPVENRNLTDGHSQGIETLVTFSPLRYWRLSASHSYIDLSLDPAGQDLNRGKFLEGATPRHQFGLRSFLDLPGGFQIDAQFRSLSAVRRSPEIVTSERIPGYSELDVRIAWQGWKQIEISVVGQNLLHDHHPEFGASASRGEIERGVYGKVLWRF
ncbi:MAG: TonB-dependent receptor plug domain-containing protein [Gammaproteobacteria bacterium]